MGRPYARPPTPFPRNVHRVVPEETRSIRAGVSVSEEDGMDQAQVTELLYQALETEQGGVRIYENAVRCAQNDDLKKE